MTTEHNTHRTSRRDFLKRSGLTVAGAAVAENLPIARSAHAQGSDQIKIALIGCGGRGTGAVAQALNNRSMPNVKLVAMADAFTDRVERCYSSVKDGCGDKVDVPKDRRFAGLDSHEKALACDVDLALLCTPPGFRPMQFEAAVKAGKHVFMEKPLATDSPGVRQVMAANKEAKKKGLAVAVGFHLRHEDKHRAGVAKIHDGAVGKLMYTRAYFNSSGVRERPRKKGQTELQYQIRNWYFFTWMCGDHIVEQHVHDIDVCNWIHDAHPIEANGQGGRQVRIGKEYGEIFDHHAVEFTYADGSKMFSYCRHTPGCWESFSQHAHGANGTVEFQGRGGDTALRVDGQKPQRFRHSGDGHQAEHDDLFAALKAGTPYNEGDWGAESTLTAIMGRMATYSGNIITWDEALNSPIGLMPKSLEWGAEPPVKPGKNGIYPCAIPGVTKVV